VAEAAAYKKAREAELAKIWERMDAVGSEWEAGIKGKKLILLVYTKEIIHLEVE
jgi:hypothetical protein